MNDYSIQLIETGEMVHIEYGYIDLYAVESQLTGYRIFDIEDIDYTADTLYRVSYKNCEEYYINNIKVGSIYELKIV